jgi:small multidrug resistance family-3 protein
MNLGSDEAVHIGRYAEVVGDEGRRFRAALIRSDETCSRSRCNDGGVTARSIALFVAAAIAEIGGAYLVWIGLRENKGALFVALGGLTLAVYGVVAALQPSHEFGRVLAAYGGVFIVGSLLWGVVFDGFRPDVADFAGAGICLVGVAVIMYAR